MEEIYFKRPGGQEQSKLVYPLTVRGDIHFKHQISLLSITRQAGHLQQASIAVGGREW